VVAALVAAKERCAPGDRWSPSAILAPSAVRAWASEPNRVLVQQLVAQAAVEALDKSVLLRHAGGYVEEPYNAMPRRKPVNAGVRFIPSLATAGP
jgi:hypothetical protein